MLEKFTSISCIPFPFTRICVRGRVGGILTLST